MIQERQNFRFASKSRNSFRIIRKLEGQKLERYFSLQLGIAGAINLSHAARSQQFENFIRLQDIAAGKSHSGRGSIANVPKALAIRSLRRNEHQKLPSIWHEIELPSVLGLDEALN